MGEPLINQLGISSIAWEPELDEAVAALLLEKHIEYVDFAPTKYIPWDTADFEIQGKKLGDYWRGLGIAPRAFQSLLFGKPHLSIFSSESRIELGEHFQSLIKLANAVGVSKLVFGSPKNRLRGSMPIEVALPVAGQVLSELAEMCAQEGLQLLLEPNPADYSCDFITTYQEAFAFVGQHASDQLKLQLDLGTCMYSKEMPSTFSDNEWEKIGYVHYSTKNLRSLEIEPNKYIEDYLNVQNQNLTGSIEILGTPGEELKDISNSIDWLRKL